MSFRGYTWKLYDRPMVGLQHLKALMVQAEVIEALPYEFATWSPLKGHYNMLRTAHYRMMLQILGAWYKSPNNRILFCNDALQSTA